MNLMDATDFETNTTLKLKHHSLTHSNETFKCESNGCDFETNTALKLKRHSLIHSNALKRHSLTHSNEAVIFKCDVCEYTSDLKHNLTRHKKEAHGQSAKGGKRKKTSQSKNRNKDLNTARKRKERDLEREQRAAEQAATKRDGGVENRCTHGPYTCYNCPPKAIAEGVKLCDEKIILYHASTNVAMCMPVSSPEVVAKNIKTFVNVSDNDKCEMRKKWATENAFGRPILSCAGCGLRDPMPSLKEYEKKNVADLSVCFEFSENSNKVFAKLQEGVVLIVVDEEGNLKDKHVDLSPIMSSFSYEKKYFYLHPEFVDGLTLFLCDQCDHMNTHNDVAKSPIPRQNAN